MASFLYFVSGHGFGHAVRSAQVMRELSALGHRCAVVSGAPRSIFDVNLKTVPFTYHHLEVDKGVAQVDGITNDLARTLRGWRIFFDNAAEWFAKASDLVRAERPDAILSDTSPMAFPLARRVGLPAFLVSSFTWEWILNYYRDDDPAFGPLAEQCGAYYRDADGMVYTPFSYGLPAVPRAIKVPLIAKRASAPKADLRKRLGLGERPAFLISYGGCGIQGIEKMELSSMPEFQFVTLGNRREMRGNMTVLPETEIPHEDALAACDAVIGKPGYGTVGECVVNRTPMVYTTRGKFAEYEPMVREMGNYFPSVFIAREDIFSGGLKKTLSAIPSFGPGHTTDTGTGAREAARVLTDWIARGR